MPVDSGMAFVVVMHLAPEHESTLPELLQRCTAMPVCQAEDQQAVEPNKVYVIPPGKTLGTLDGHLTLSDPKPLARGRHVAVDLFFRTLADTQGPHAAAIVLSGANGDGAIGMKRIKERGGLTVAQDPDEAEHTSMPRAAIATGMVDWVLPVADMPDKLRQYFGLAKAAEAAARGRAAGAAEDGRPRRTGSRDGGRAGLPAHPHQPRFHLLQARHRGAAHRPAHAGQRRHRPAGLPRLPAHPLPAKPTRCCRTC